MDHQNPTEYLAVKQVKTEYPCLSTGSLANLRCRKEGPKYYKINRKVLYRRSDLEAWLGSQPVLTSDSLTERG